MNPKHSWTTNDWSARMLQLDYGQQHDGHEHWPDHVTVIVKGPAQVDVDGQDPMILDRGDAVVLPAVKKHKFTALHERGAAWRCVFSYQHAMKDGVAQENFDKDK